MKHWTSAQRIIWTVSVCWLLFLLLSRFISSIYYYRHPDYYFRLPQTLLRDAQQFVYPEYPAPFIMGIPLALVLLSIYFTGGLDGRRRMPLRLLILLVLIVYGLVLYGIGNLFSPAASTTIIVNISLLLVLCNSFWKRNSTGALSLATSSAESVPEGET
ncbi:MAG: hypothetical protein R3F46_08090 [bacterium]